MALTKVQTNFTSGELDPRLASRIDIQQYYNGAERLRNVVVNPLGGAVRCPGLEHIDELRPLMLDDGVTITATAPNGGTAANASDDDVTTVLTTTGAIGTTNPYVVAHYDLGAAVEVHSAEIIGAATDVSVTSNGDTGWRNFSSFERDGSIGVPGGQWSNRNFLGAVDGKAAVSQVGSAQVGQYLRCQNANLSALIPAGATITGVEVRVLRRYKPIISANPVRDNRVHLVVDGKVVGTNKASASGWPLTFAYQTYGGSSDLWGWPLTRDQVVKSDFGFAIAAKLDDGIGADALIDHLQIKVYYSSSVIASPSEFRIQYSTDDVAWNNYGSAFAVRDNDEVSFRHEATITAQYWRYARVGATDLGAAVASVRSFNVYANSTTVGDAVGLSDSKLLPFDFNLDQRYMLLFTDRNIAVYERGAFVVNVPSPYTSEQLARVQYDQKLDTIILFHPDLRPQRMQRQGAADKWVLKSAVFEYIPKFAFTLTETNPAATLTLSAAAGSITVTASAGVFTADHVGQYIRGNGGRARIDRFDSTTILQATVIVQFLDETTIASGSWTLETGYEDAWSDSRGWPVCGGFRENRLIIGGSRSLPDRTWGSRLFQFFDFNPGFGYADDAIEAAIENTDVAGIQAINVRGKHLQFFTKTAEFYVPQAENEALTPSNFKAKLTSSVGIKRGTPIVNVGSKTLFIQTEGQSVQEFSLQTGISDTGNSYSIYSATDITTLSSHLISNPVDMAFRRSISTNDPNLILVVNDDGTLAILTKLDEQGVNAWTLRSTNGTFLKAGVIGDEIYFVVERTINGTPRRFLERFNNDCLLDACVLVNVDADTGSATGLDHLEGEEVQIILDEALQNPQTVASETVTFVRDAEESYQVGFGFDPLIRPMPVARSPDGRRVLSGKKRIVEVLLFLYQTRWIEVAGPTGNSRAPGMQTFGPAPSPLDNVLQPFTGRKTVGGLIGWSEAGQVDITQGNIPASLTLTGLEMQVMV